MSTLAERFIVEVFLDNPTADLAVLKHQVYSFVERHKSDFINYELHKDEFKQYALEKVCEQLGFKK